MTQYIIYFNQTWVGDHSEEWFASRGPLANAVVEDIKAAGAYVFAAGVEEDMGRAFSADATSGTPVVTDTAVPVNEARIGGLTIIDVAEDEAAKMWGGKMAAACGWPQEIRRLY